MTLSRQIALACFLIVAGGCSGPQNSEEARVTNANPSPDNCEWYHPPPPPLPDGSPNHTAVRLTLEDEGSDGNVQHLSVRITAPNGSSRTVQLGVGSGCEPRQSADGLEIICQDSSWEIAGEREQVVVRRGTESVATFKVDGEKALAFEVQRL